MVVVMNRPKVAIHETNTWISYIYIHSLANSEQVPLAANKANLGNSQGELAISVDSFTVSDCNLRLPFVLVLEKQQSLS